MWISFTNFGEPNKELGGKYFVPCLKNRALCAAGWSCNANVSHAVDAENWPVYTLDDPQNFVFEQNISSHAEPDLYRAEGIKYINNLIVARAGTDCKGLEACGWTDTGDEIYFETLEESRG